jgi:hypothetical protein
MVSGVSTGVSTDLGPAKNGWAFAVYAQIRKTIAVRCENSSPCEMQICVFGFWEIPDLRGRQTVIPFVHSRGARRKLL